MFASRRRRLRFLATATLCCAVQGWVVAPLADAALRHDPAAAAECPTQSHLERPSSGHGEAECLLWLAHVPTMPAGAPAIGIVRVAIEVGQATPAALVLPRAPTALLPPSRAPPPRA